MSECKTIIGESAVMSHLRAENARLTAERDAALTRSTELEGELNRALGEIEGLDAECDRRSRAITAAEAARVILSDRWGGYGSASARKAMFEFVYDQHGRHMIPMSGYDGVMQAGLRGIAQATP